MTAVVSCHRDIAAVATSIDKGGLIPPKHPQQLSRACKVVVVGPHVPSPYSYVERGPAKSTGASKLDHWRAEVVITAVLAPFAVVIRHSVNKPFTRNIMRAQRPTLIQLALLPGLLAGCADRQPQSTPQAAVAPSAAASSQLPAEVIDATWQWVSFTTPVEQVKVDAPERYTIRFESSGRVTIQADCNRGGSSYSATADR